MTAMIEGRKALQVMKDFQCKITMELENKKVVETLHRDRFSLMDKDTATDGVLIMSIDNGEKKTAIVKIPKGEAIYHHFHSFFNEMIMVVTGNINYIVYESDRRSEVIDKGILREGQKLIIPAGQTHYVFTGNLTSYLRVDFNEKI